MPEILRAYGTARKLNLGELIQVAETPVLRRVAGAVALDYGEGRQVHAFDFGGLVLIGVSPDDVRPLLRLLQGQDAQPPELDEFLLDQGSAAVSFDAVRLPDRDPDLLRVVSRALAQSAALDRLERETEALLADVTEVVDQLRQRGRIARSEKALVQFIGAVLYTRRNLVAGLAVLDKPEEAWEDSRASELTTALTRNFEIEERFKSLTEKLALVQDSLEVITDVWRSRHSNKLEWLVIALISVEIVMALLERLGHALGS